MSDIAREKLDEMETSNRTSHPQAAGDFRRAGRRKSGALLDLAAANFRAAIRDLELRESCADPALAYGLVLKFRDLVRNPASLAAVVKAGQTWIDTPAPMKATPKKATAKKGPTRTRERTVIQDLFGSREPDSIPHDTDVAPVAADLAVLPEQASADTINLPGALPRDADTTAERNSSEGSQTSSEKDGSASGSGMSEEPCPDRATTFVGIVAHAEAAPNEHAPSKASVPVQGQEGSGSQNLILKSTAAQDASKNQALPRPHYASATVAVPRRPGVPVGDRVAKSDGPQEPLALG